MKNKNSTGKIKTSASIAKTKPYGSTDMQPKSMTLKSWIYIISILVVGFFLRFYQIDSYPTLNPDEAAIAYNSYSLIKTGLDEHGQSWPIHFRSFGDYKPGGYFYLAAPFIAVFGPSTFSVRLPNLILSVTSIYFVFLLVRLLSASTSLALLSAMFLSISPWHIHFSRGAWESSAALSLIIIGTYCFYLSRLSRFWLCTTLFVIFYVYSLYTYHSARIFAPLLGLFLFISNYHHLANNLKRYLLVLIFGFILCLPLANSLISGGALARLSGVGLSADSGPLWRSNELLNQHHPSKPFFLFYRVIHNHRFNYLISWAQKYASHFDPNFLFLTGDDVPRSKTPEFGQNYLYQLPLLFIGLSSLVSHRRFRRFFAFLLTWLFIAPLASSFTFQSPSALRSLPMSIPIAIFVAAGSQHLLARIRQLHSFRIARLSFAILIIFGLCRYFDAYFVHSLKRYPFAWNYGFDQITDIINQKKNSYSHIFVTNQYDQPYILYLFYSRYPPRKLHPQITLTKPDRFGFSTVSQIDNIYFGQIIWDNIPQNSLVIAADESIPQNPLTVVNFPNGLPGFKIYTK